MAKKKQDSTVKIDANLLEAVEAFISREKNKFKYVNRKQFIDIAVHEFLQHEKRGKRNKRR